ncbi:MAG: hypothetical protein GY804_11560 [Alphaproteobacteria bacterium]|nr:hypothetical protein [Alphaproteobacteria bacterium]
MNEELTEREREIINNCRMYAENNPAGLPGHNLMIIIYKLEKCILREENYNREQAENYPNV